jgi:hypothetical protein
MAGESGTNIRLKLNGNVIAGKISTGITFDRDEIELSDADDGADSNYTMGRKRVEATGQFNLNTTATNNDTGDLWDAWDAATSLPFIYGGTDSGDLIFTGNCYVRTMDFADPDNDRSTVDVTFRMYGAVSKSTYS